MTRSAVRLAALLLLGPPGPVLAQEAAPVRLTLEEAVETALERNAGLEAVRQRVDETERRSSVAFTNYLPRIQTNANYLANNNTQGILLPAGSIGYFSELGGLFPRTDRTIPQGGTDIFFALTTVAQPLTQYFKIRQGRRVLRADESVAGAQLRQARQDVILGTIQAFSGLLIAQRSIAVAEVRVSATEERTRYAARAVASGRAAEIEEREGRVRWLQARQALLEREDDVDDVMYTLADLLGLPAGTRLELVAPEVPVTRPAPLETYVEAALRSNPEVLEARALIDKATHGVGAARAEYIPDLAILGGHLYQNSFPFFPKNTFGVGLTGSWTILDFGERRRTIQEREAQLGQAQGNLATVEGRVRGEVEAAYRRLLRTLEVLDLAREARDLVAEATRLRIVQVGAGLAVPAQEQEATADRLEAGVDLLKAELDHMIAVAELERAAGTLGSP